MNVWARKSYSADESEALDDAQILFEALFKAVGSPRHMTLMSVDEGDATTLFVELPHAALLLLFANFTPIDGKDVPADGELLVGFEDRFERQFRHQALSSV